MLSEGRRKKLEEWEGRLTRFESWSQSVAAFCESEKVSAASFYQWKRKLRNAEVNAEGSTDLAGISRSFQELELAQVVSSPAAASTSTAMPTVIRLGERVSIQLGTDLSVADLVVKQLLAATLDSAEPQSC